MWSRRASRDDRGASLVMAMVFLTSVGLVVTALLSYGVTALTSASSTAVSAQSSAEVAGAMQAAINDIRNSEYDNDGSTTCWPGGSRQVYPPLTAGGQRVTVTCSPVAGSGAASESEVPINPANRPPNAILTLGEYWVGAAAGTPPAAPRDVVVTPPVGNTGTAVVVNGANFASASAIQIGTTAELAAATGATLSPCADGVAAAGCFAADGNKLTIASMPAHALGSVQIKVITVGASAAAAFVYATAPAAPARPTAVAGPLSATVTWVAPSNGGSPITRYLVTPFRNGVAQTPVSVPASPTQTTIPGLAAGVSHTFTVAAVNDVGTGPASPASSAVTPTATVPAAPSGVTATASTLAAVVRWTGPPSDGGSTVNGYVVTPYVGAAALTSRTFPSQATTQTITGLTAGVTYTFTVSARNAIGTGPASGASNAVTINANPSLTFPNPLPGGRWRVPYSYELSSSGGTEPFTWTISAGSLPSGLTLSASTGVISGTPTCFLCREDFTVRLTDASGASTSRSTSITITWFGPNGAPAGPTNDHEQTPAAFRDADPRRVARRGARRPSSRPPRRGRSSGWTAAGRLTALLVATGIAASGLIAGTPSPAAAAGSELFNQPFHNNSPNGSGGIALPGLPRDERINQVCLSAAGNASTGQLRSCLTNTDPAGSGKLRLTDTTTYKTGGLFGASSVPMSLGLDVTFNLYQYGGTNPYADGIGFVLSAVDPAVPVAPENLGSAGGALGYSPGDGDRGLAHGYLGVGFDVYGNFSNNAYQGDGCVDPPYLADGATVPGQVVVRGPGHRTTGYCAINSTATTSSPRPPVVPLRAATRAASKVPVEVLINPTTSALTSSSGRVVAPNTYQVVFKPVGQPTRTLSGALPTVPDGLYPKRWLNAGKFPKHVAFGWVGSTGAHIDYHEIDDARVATLSPLPAPELVVGQTVYAAPTLAPGDPVTYEVVAGVLPGTPEPYSIVVTETLPAGVKPVAGFGPGWDCDPPVGQTITCTNTNVPFPADSTLPPLTITATVTAPGITPQNLQTNSIVSADSPDADIVYGGEAGLRNSGENPLRIEGNVYSNTTAHSRTALADACTDSWPVAPGRVDCNGMYVNGSVITERPCPGKIAIPATEVKSCNTGTHAPAGDDPGLAAPASYAQPTAGLTRQALPICSATSPVVTFTPGYYDDAVGLSALTTGAAACKNKTFWFQPGTYYFDFHNSEMPTSGSPAVPYGSDVWTFNDPTSVLVGGAKNGWTTGGVTAAQVPGACVSPLKSITATGVQFVFGSDSRFVHLAGSVELCGTYSGTKPPITLSGSTGAGGSAPTSATLRPSALSASSTPSSAPTFTPVNSTSAIVSETDGEGPGVTNLPASSTATLRVSAVSGLATPIPARSVLDGATITVRHGEQNATAGTTLTLVYQPTRAGAEPITRPLPVSRTSTLTYTTHTVDIADELESAVYGFGSEPFTLDVVLATSSATQSVTAKMDYLRLDLTWRSTAIRPQSGCVVTVGRCAVFASAPPGGQASELYVQGTVYLPKARLYLGVRFAEAPVVADGVIVRALMVQSDAYAGASVYDGPLISVPSFGLGPSPLVVYLTAWICPTGACSPTPSLEEGWKVAGRTSVQYTDDQTGVVSGERAIDVLSWQVAK